MLDGLAGAICEIELGLVEFRCLNLDRVKFPRITKAVDPRVTGQARVL